MARGKIQRREEAPGDDADDRALTLLRWHIERYDRLRVSTAGRASAVLSAGAILSAGNALLLGQLLGGDDGMPAWWMLACTAVALLGATLVVGSLVKAANVLVTVRSSREILPDGASLPRSLLFNGTDTVAHVKNFDEFRTAVRGQHSRDIRQAAEVELWVGIQQHRQRYHKLRESVRLLRLAALLFVTLLALVLVVNAVLAI
ncbi:hypothetical protein [Micromonospora robiginosa]|uniref:Uncharacterized protein n=1 Tax=Micromonospora robiginosa TaxID=2749844 RepID=A0A7L6BBZ8_9ACTN|nr:hypothetical protein [Micromonospora ferruginea]QLQ39476.1 hypothetical protein H1D33_11960 [Micromonospora ferruginea]